MTLSLRLALSHGPAARVLPGASLSGPRIGNSMIWHRPSVTVLVIGLPVIVSGPPIRAGPLPVRPSLRSRRATARQADSGSAGSGPAGMIFY